MQQKGQTLKGKRNIHIREQKERKDTQAFKQKKKWWGDKSNKVPQNSFRNNVDKLKLKKTQAVDIQQY